MKTIIISGINLFEGGPLSVYKDCIDNIIKSKLNERNNVIAFVYKKELFAEYVGKIKLIELPNSRKNYLFRIWYEYIYFYFYSRNKNIDVWVSLHDITPNVNSKKRYVYCHNPTPFMKTELQNLKYSYKNFLFSLFYKYLYKINIRKNTAVIVQQDWIRDEFIKMYKIKNAIVARPTVNINRLAKVNISDHRDNKYQFLYPAYPRFFKNFEVICEACKILEGKGIKEFEVFLTLDGKENRYSIDLIKKYGGLASIKFIGLQNRDTIFEMYNTVDCLIFPSSLETWGLPISEFKYTSKPILLVDLPYAHETIGSYNKACFFSPNDAKGLSYLMEKEISKTNSYIPVIEKIVKKPYANTWKELLDILIS